MNDSAPATPASTVKTPSDSVTPASTSTPQYSDAYVAADALFACDPDCDRVEWLKICGGYVAAGGNEHDWLNWSRQSAKFNESDAKTAWSKNAKTKRVNAGSLFHIAIERGWQNPNGNNSNRNNYPRRRATRSIIPPVVKATAPVASSELPAKILAMAKPVVSHEYLTAKKIPTEYASGWRVISIATVLKITRAKSLRGKKCNLTGDLLVVPVHNFATGELQTLQFIDPTGNKGFLAAHGAKGGVFYCMPMPDAQFTGTIYIAEGVATALTICVASGQPTIAAMSLGSAAKTYQATQWRYPFATIVWCGDVGKTGGMATDKSLLECAPLAVCPDSAIDGYDFNDLYRDHGADAVVARLKTAEVISARDPIDASGRGAALVALQENPDDLNIRRAIDSYIGMVPCHKSMATVASTIAENAPDTPIEKIQQEINNRWHGVWNDDPALRIRGVKSSFARRAKLTGIELTGFDAALKASRQHRTDHPEVLCHLIKAPHGSGKTYHFARHEFNGYQRVVWVSHLISLVANTAAMLDADRYDQIRSTSDHVVTTLHSVLIGYIKASIEQADLIVIDEAAHVLAVLHDRHNSTITTKAREIADFLFQQLRAKPSILLDADLSDFDAAVLDQYGIKTASFNVKTDNVTPLEITLHRSVGNTILSVITAIQSGTAVLIAADNAGNAGVLDCILRQQGIENGLLITGRAGETTTFEPDVQRFLKEPDKTAREMALPYVIYTPAVESGLSINNPYWQRHFGIYGGHIKPADFAQMIRRDRTATRFEIAIDGTGFNPARSSQQELIANIRYANIANAVLLGEAPNYAEFSDFENIRLAYEGKANAHCHLYAQELFLQLENLGHNVTVEYEFAAFSWEQQSFHEWFSAHRQHHTASIASEIAQHDPIDADSASDLKKQRHITRVESQQLLGFEISKVLKVEQRAITALDIDLYADGAIKRRIENFAVALHGTDPAWVASDLQEIENNSPRDHRSHRALRAKAIATVVGILREHGLDIASGSGRITAASAARCFAAIKTTELARRGGLTVALGVRFGDVTDHIKWLQGLLSKFGLWLDGERITDQSGNRWREYTIAHPPKVGTSGRVRVAGFLKMNTLATALADVTKAPLDSSLDKNIKPSVQWQQINTIPPLVVPPPPVAISNPVESKDHERRALDADAVPTVTPVPTVVPDPDAGCIAWLQATQGYDATDIATVLGNPDLLTILRADYERATGIATEPTTPVPLPIPTCREYATSAQSDRQCLIPVATCGQPAVAKWWQRVRDLPLTEALQVQVDSFLTRGIDLATG